MSYQASFSIYTQDYGGNSRSGKLADYSQDDDSWGQLLLGALISRFHNSVSQAGAQQSQPKHKPWGKICNRHE